MESYLLSLNAPGSVSDPYLTILLVLSIFVGAFVTSGFGVGGAVLTTPLFVFLLPPKFAIGLLAPLNLFINTMGARQYWKKWNRRHLLILLPAALTGVWVGSYLLAVIPVILVVKIVGFLATIFGIFQFFTINRPQLRERFRPKDWQGVGLGFASGITSAMAHIGGVVFSFYLLPNSKDRESFVATTVFMFMSTAILKIMTFSYYQLLTLPMFILALFLLPASILGNLLGKWLNQRLSNRRFTQIISIFIALMGLRLILG